ncbi:MAG: CRISPR-associated protein Cas4 [Chloroflexi bacterium]|nr:CRISPR-associated protein Cas4 [Chloroflexota bacterium]
MGNLIPVSWLHTYGYCERQLYLEHVLGVELEATVEMQQGTKAHASLDEAHKATAELELTVAGALEKAREEGALLSAREVPVRGTQLIGCIDDIVFMPDRILIVDDKPGFTAWPRGKMQVWGYCLAFEEEHTPQLPIVAVIRNRDTGQRAWQRAFARRHRQQVQGAVARIRMLLNGEVKPKGVRNPRKCGRCRFRDRCEIKSA